MDAEEKKETLYIYSLSGYDRDGIREEVFLTHTEHYHANEFQSMVIHVMGKLRKEEDFEQMTVHDASRLLRKKFGFQRANYLNCIIWDMERNVICDATQK